MSIRAEGAGKRSRVLGEQDLAYDRIGDRWTGFVDNFDTARRVEVLVCDFLGRERVAARSCLDAGCGLGEFSRALWSLQPSRLVALDISPRLISRLRALLPQADCREGDLMDLRSALADETFDVVVSSEVIEHTPDPRRAVHELARHCRCGGLLAVSCPNRRWIWLLQLANLLRIRRHYRGYENWVFPLDLLGWLREEGFEILRAEGIHTVPWHFLPGSLLRRIDSLLRRRNYKVALNLAVLARYTGKPSPRPQATTAASRVPAVRSRDAAGRKGEPE